MLKLRKILLLNSLYIIIFFIVIIISIIRINIHKENNYKEKTITNNYVVTKYYIDDKVLTINLENKEKTIGKYYFKEKIEIKNFKDTIKLGDTIKVTGTIKIPNSNTSKYLFNYKKYLERKDIFYILEIDSYKKIKSNKNIYYFLKQKLKIRLNENPYLNILILGDKSYVTTKVLNSYQENGISHLFAISGMHIALLSGLIISILNKLSISENKKYIITSIFLILYLLFAETSASILRGVFFFIFFSLNKLYYFYIKPENIFILVLSLVLLINPNYLFDLGFQYSFLISYYLIKSTKFLNSKSYIKSLLKVSLISFIVSIPITIYNFYQINLLSIIYNLFYVPLVSLVIFPLSLIVLIFPILEPIYNNLTFLMETSSIILSNISLFKIYFMRLPIFMYIIYFIIIHIVINKIVKGNLKYLYILIIILFIHWILPKFNCTSYLQMIDVGQGDSILLKINKEIILIDTGGKEKFFPSNRIKENSIVKTTTIPILKSKGIYKIKTLVLTHGDADHMGEAINLVNNFKIEKVIFNCGPYNDLEKELIKVLDKKKIKYYSCIKELNIDKNKLYFLQTKEYDNENDNSNVIYTELNGYKFMFMGDAGIDKERDILDKYNLQDIDVLKVGHHGSKTSSSKEFIDEINPRYSIISVGKNNRYGHPNDNVLDNLEDSKIYRTDQDGSIMFKIKNNKLEIETCTP